jgi:tRNA (guanine-N7-)-methyltransferase
MKTPPTEFRLRSFVHRGRQTDAQERAYDSLWPLYGLEIEKGCLDFQQAFGRESARYLEIGFGSGHSLLALAHAQPANDFIGVEAHKPGIGALFQGIQQNHVTNLRVYHGDVVDVLEKCIPDACLDGVQIFFPDPWPKRRHHQRRLIQPDFIRLVVSKLKSGGILHLATDWEDYSRHMMCVVSQEPQLVNLAGEHQFSSRSPQRPVLTKFERRAEREGRQIRELQFRKR